MYAISSAVSRKLMGTSVRPYPLTPKYDVKNRPEFGLTMAIRSPCSTPRSSSARAMPRARAANSA